MKDPTGSYLEATTKKNCSYITLQYCFKWISNIVLKEMGRQ